MRDVQELYERARKARNELRDLGTDFFISGLWDRSLAPKDKVTAEAAIVLLLQAEAFSAALRERIPDAGERNNAPSTKAGWPG